METIFSFFEAYPLTFIVIIAVVFATVIGIGRIAAHEDGAWSVAFCIGFIVCIVFFFMFFEYTQSEGGFTQLVANSASE